MRLPVARIVLLVCALLAVIPATAGAATTPKVTKVTPLHLKIGERLTIRGNGFLPGKNRNTVVFKATGARAVFAKAQTATKTKLVVRVPAKLASFLKVKAGQPTATRFQLRVLARKLSPAYTPVKKSPVVEPVAAAAATPVGNAPAAGSAPAAPAAAAPAAAMPAPSTSLSPYEQCQANARVNAAGDEDADGMTNGDELTYHVDPCVSDADADGMVDGYEYQSALDLNNSNNSTGSGRPYPGKRPWPNPLDGTDGAYDFDGDGLLLHEEYDLWWFTGHRFPVTQYSDGLQASGARLPAAGATDPRDLNHNGALTDDERDADLDGLSNVVEYHLRGPEGWWSNVAKQPAYTLRTFSSPDPLVWDTDGDGIGDGDDDQDVDGFNNVTEIQLVSGTGGLAEGEVNLYVSPYNPCMPNPHSDTCSRYIPFGSTAWLPWWEGHVVPLGSKVPFTADLQVAGPGDDSWDDKPGNPNN